jgi:hypothetical protein
MTCASDWIPFHLGDVVREHEGRHEGTVQAVHWAAQIKVKWESGVTEWLDINQLTLVAKAKRITLDAGSELNTGPRTLVESPKRRLQRELAVFYGRKQRRTKS